VGFHAGGRHVRSKIGPADQQKPFSDRFSPFSADRLGGKSCRFKVLAMRAVFDAEKKR
jgi:hypothetical protein